MKQLLAGVAVLAFSAPVALACPMNTTAQSKASDYVVAQADVPMSTTADAVDTDTVTGSTNTDELPAE